MPKIPKNLENLAHATTHQQDHSRLYRAVPAVNTRARCVLVLSIRTKNDGLVDTWLGRFVGLLEAGEVRSSDTMSSSDSVQGVVFKKRTPKGQLRGTMALVATSLTANESKDQEGEEEGDEIDTQLLLDKKMEQKLRQRQSGFDAETLIKPLRARAAPSAGDSKKGLHSIGAQFSSQSESASGTSGGAIAHQKIMEQYVEDKLAVKRKAAEALLGGESDPQARETNALAVAEESLYRVPAELKAIASGSGAPNNDSDNPDKGAELDVGLSSGISEVALPQSFKRAAEKALRQAVVNGELLPAALHPSNKSNELMRNFMKNSR